MAEPSSGFVLHIKSIMMRKQGKKEISYQDTLEGANNLIGFFDLLYKIDCRKKDANLEKSKKNIKRRDNFR